MKKVSKIFIAVLFVSAVACNQTGKKTATQSNAKSVSGMVAEMDGDSVQACPKLSKIYWEGSKPGGSHNGTIKIKEGNYLVKDGKLVGGDFIIDMNSIVDEDIQNEGMNKKLVGHLKSPDFFNVDSFPEARFVITRVDEISEENYSQSITGNLTIKGFTHPITFKANVSVNDGKVTATSEDFYIDRTLWKVSYNSKSVFKELKDNLINDEIGIRIEVYSK